MFLRFLLILILCFVKYVIMASDTISTPKVIVPYEWILENVEEQTAITIASKMILFRGERVFRVGLKNHAKSPILFFMAIDLGKIGMKVEDVTYQIQGSSTGPVIIKLMTKENIGDGGSLQLFKTPLDKKIIGNCTFSFRIIIEGVISCYSTYGYSYRLSDRLAKDQLWAALKIQRHLADVEFVVKDKTFPVHKAILAARSRVFADEFEKVQPVKDVPHQIRIDGVEPSTVKKFLHFVYTGEPMGTLADEELLKLANKYGLLALSGLCQVALKKIEAMQMAKVMDIINNGVEAPNSSSKIMPDKDTEIIFDRTTPTFRCALRFTESGIPKCIMEYKKEELFFAYITGNFGESCISKPGIHFTCAKHRKFGLKIEDIYCQLKNNRLMVKLEAKKSKENAKVLLRFNIWYNSISLTSKFIDFNLDIKTMCTIGNYNYEMMDDAWPTDFWMAATNQKLTDVEIFVGTVKVMEAHRVILCARSPVLNLSFSKIRYTEKSIVIIEAEFDVEIVKNFLNFLYTGSLKTTDGGHQLGKLAAMYDVETLKNVCQLLNANPPDAEELTDYLLQL